MWKKAKPEGLLAGVLGLNSLGLVTTEGFVNGFPLKLLLMGLLVSEFLALEFGLPDIIVEAEALFEGKAIDFDFSESLNDGFGSESGDWFVQKKKERERENMEQENGKVLEDLGGFDFREREMEHRGFDSNG